MKPDTTYMITQVHLNPHFSMCFTKHSQEDVEKFKAEYKNWKTRRVDNVEIEENEIATLENIFKLGQNDFQPRDVRSMSVGDITIYANKIYLCEGVGWSCIGEV